MQSDTGLTRTLGVRQLATIIFNYTVGSGIFALPALAVARLGAAAPLSYLVCTALMGLVLLCFAEAGSRISQTGGVYAYVERAFGPVPAAITGGMLYFTALFAGAAVAVLLTHTTAALLGWQSTFALRALLVLVVGVFVALNVRGLRSGARAIEWITLAKLVPLLLFALVGASHVHASNLAWHAVPSTKTVLATAGVVLFAYSGIESAMSPSGEVARPWYTVPRAGVLALGAVTVLYLAIQWVALGVMGEDLAADPVTPLARAAQVFAGAPGRELMIVGATVSMWGYMSANILSAPRALYAMARDGLLARRLARVHPVFHTPHWAILCHGLLVVALALSGTYERLAIFSNMTGFTLYIVCACAVLRLRALGVTAEGPAFRIPGGALVPLLAIAANAALIVATAGRADAIGLAGISALSLALYGWRALRRTSTNRSVLPSSGGL